MKIKQDLNAEKKTKNESARDRQVSKPMTSYKTTKDFHEAGKSIAEWARENEFSVRLVYAVLRGERKCLRGESYEIARKLGMK